MAGTNFPGGVTSTSFTIATADGIAAGAFTGNITGNVTGNVAGYVIGAEAAEVVAATNVITAAESGFVYYLSAATEFVSTLPAPALGLTYEFIVAAAPVGASYTIVTNSSANIIKGQAYPASGAAGDTGTADDTITFVDGQAVAGDRVVVKSDGTSWFAYAYCAVAAGVTFTQASA